MAQTTGTWALTANSNCSVSGSSFTGSAMVKGSGVGTLSYGSDGVYCNSWANTMDANDYYSYTITASTNINITSVSLYTMRSGNAGTARVYYSVNGGAETAFAASFSVPSSSTQTSYTGLNIAVNNGQTFMVKVYAWGLQNSARNFYNKNVVVTGQVAASAPTISTPTYASVTSSSAVLGGNVTNVNGANVTERGIYYSTTDGFANGTGTKVSETGNWGAGVFTVNVSGLNNPVTYYFKAFATNSVNTSYTTQSSFSTPFASAATDYFRTKGSGNWNSVAIWESSHNGTNWYDATLKPDGNATMVYLNHNVNLAMHEACDDLTFNGGGSVTFGDYNLTINGTITGQPVYYYTGTGLPSQETNNSNTEVTINNPASLPAVLNDLTINVGAGNVALPNDVTYNSLNLNSGLHLNGNKITHNGVNIAFSSDDAVLSSLTDTYGATSNVYNHHGVDNYSIASTWRLSGSFTGSLDIHFTYPKAQSSSPFMRVWYRSAGAAATDPWYIWGGYDLVGLPAVDNGTTMTVTIYGVNTLSDGAKGPMNWTISELDQTLPVELSTFTAWLTQQYFVELHWVTQSETDVTGYNVYRNSTTAISSASRVNPYLIQASNTSQEAAYNFVDIDAELGTWYYWLECKNMNGISEFYGPISITVTDGSGSPNIPELTKLANAYPNPFNPASSMLTSSFTLSKSEEISISIFNVKGEKVRSLINGNHNAGSYSINWNGKDEHGKVCSSGVYYMTMSTSNYSTTRKIVLMK